MSFPSSSAFFHPRLHVAALRSSSTLLAHTFLSVFACFSLLAINDATAMSISQDKAAETAWDYIVVGGLAGSVVAHRLRGFDSTTKILVVEAGPNANERTDIIWPNSTNGIGGDFDWQDVTAAQPHLNGRALPFPLGKALGGGGWVRGHKFDYDLWGSTVGDDRWSYDGLLPYLRKSEEFWNTTINSQQHGLDGPIFIQSVTSTDRRFPLRQQALDSWAELGVGALPDLDGNAGKSLGVGELQENKENGRREIAAVRYPLDGFAILANTTVARILTAPTQGTACSIAAVAIELASGVKIHGREIILSAGAIRSPQLLKLSGIGPRDELAGLDIPVILNQPGVGSNLADHGLFAFGFLVRDPAAGWALGSANPLLTNERYGWGTPADFVVSTDVPRQGLAAAIAEDEGAVPDAATHPLLAYERAFHEHVIMYAGAPDGSIVSIANFTMVTTATGSVKLASTSAVDPPLIDPNYIGTAVDRYVAREAVRIHLQLGASDNTVLRREILNGEAGGLTLDSNDEEIDARVRAVVGTGYRPVSTVAPRAWPLFQQLSLLIERKTYFNLLSPHLQILECPGLQSEFDDSVPLAHRCQ
ncbi:hypothetical protein S40293_09972 [Stachybotrys chartarum IBT 40293]|nr:hypothetical protein S40293_09972 [Stachybotrys chartarum IBT 40293]